MPRLGRAQITHFKTYFDGVMSTTLWCYKNSGSSFVANAAGKGGSGGGLWIEDGAKAVVTSTELVNNTAASSYTHKAAGGGIVVSASALLTMSNGCRLEGNVAGPEVWWAVGRRFFKKSQ